MESCGGFIFLFVLAATQLASSSVLTRDRTQAPAVKAQKSDHQIAREFPKFSYLLTQSQYTSVSGQVVTVFSFADYPVC